MKKNVPKFLLAKNEAASPGATYIVHTQEPAFVSEIKRFDSGEERDIYMTENADKLFWVVNRVVIIEHKKYLISTDEEKRQAYLEKRLKHWVIANVLNSSVF